MASPRNLHRYTRMVALSHVEKLAAQAALNIARDTADKALVALEAAHAACDQTLQFWQARLLAPTLDPALFGQLNWLVTRNETAHAEAAKSSEDAQSQVLARQRDFGEVESRHSVLLRALVRARRKLQRKREESAADARVCELNRGPNGARA